MFYLSQCVREHLCGCVGGCVHAFKLVDMDMVFINPNSIRQ